MIVENKETKNHSECQNHNTEWPKFYEKMEILESRLNQLTENMKSQQHDIKQSFNMLHQYLLVHKDDENKKQLTNNNDDRFNENRIVNTITQNVNSMIGNEVEYVIKEEINGNVLPCKLYLIYLHFLTTTFLFNIYIILIFSFKKHYGYIWSTIPFKNVATS